MTLPNFLLIGAQKCGTTWLDRMLRQHPQVFVTADKELHFWDREARWQGGLEAYAQYFEGAEDHHIAVGECTPNYLWTVEDRGRDGARGTPNHDLPARVAEALPAAKLIVLLRDPVQRAVSAYFHHMRKRRVKPSESILDTMDLYGIASMGYYDLHLERWWEVYGREQTLVLFYETAVRSNRAQTMRRVFEFLGVDPHFEVAGIDGRPNPRRSHLFFRMNARARPVAWLMEHGLPRRIKDAPRWRLDPDPKQLAALSEHFAPHDERLSELLGQPLPWRT